MIFDIDGWLHIRGGSEGLRDEMFLIFKMAGWGLNSGRKETSLISRNCLIRQLY